MERKLDTPRIEQMEERFIKAANDLISKGVWKYTGFYDDLKDKFLRSDSSDAVFYVLNPFHLVKQEMKDHHKIRITFDVKASINHIYFPGKYLIPKLDQLITTWKISKYLITLDRNRFYFQARFRCLESQGLLFRENNSQRKCKNTICAINVLYLWLKIVGMQVTVQMLLKVAFIVKVISTLTHFVRTEKEHMNQMPLLLQHLLHMTNCRKMRLAHRQNGRPSRIVLKIKIMNFLSIM